MQAFEDTPAPLPPPNTENTRPLEILVAIAANGVIGNDNRLPWHLPPDLKRFKALTIGHAMLMGRKTWDSIGRALPARQSIVITQQPDFSAAGAERAGSLAAAITLVRCPPPIFCIGGEQIFRMALPFASRMHVTEIGAAIPGDIHFPAIDARDWREIAREEHPGGADAPFPYAFVTYERTCPLI